MDKKFLIVLGLVMIVTLAYYVLLPMYNTMKDSYDEQTELYKEKNTRYEQVVSWQNHYFAS